MMNRYGAAAYVLIANLLKVLVGLVITKAIAIYSGPAGVAVFSQFQNFTQVAGSIAVGAGNSGITAYTSENKDNRSEIQGLLGTGLVCSLAICGLFLTLAFASFDYLVKDYFGGRDIDGPLKLFLISLPIYAVNIMALSFLNGLKEFKTWALINIAQSIFCVAAVQFLITQYGLVKTLAVFTLMQVFTSFTITLLARKYFVGYLRDFVFSLDKKILRYLTKFALMGSVSLVAGPLALFLIRSYLGHNLGWQDAGLWQALVSLSSVFVMVLMTTCTVFYLPRIAEISEPKEIISEAWGMFGVLFPFACVSALVIYVGRDVALLLLFDERFLVVADLLKWQLLGDLSRAAAVSFAYVFVAKAKVGIHLTLEIFFGVLSVVLTLYLVKLLGLKGAPMAYFMQSVIYGFVVLSIFHKIYLRR